MKIFVDFNKKNYVLISKEYFISCIIKLLYVIYVGVFFVNYNFVICSECFKKKGWNFFRSLILG